MSLDSNPNTFSQLPPSADEHGSSDAPVEEQARQQLEQLCSSLRHEQNELAKAEQIGRAKVLYEIAYPSARRGGARGKKGGGKEASSVDSFAAYLHKETLLSERSVRIYAAIASKIGDQLRDEIRGTAVAHEKELLRKLSTLTEDRQRTLWSQFKADQNLQALKKASTGRSSTVAPREEVPAELILQVGDHVSVRRGSRALRFAIFAVTDGQVHIRHVEEKAAIGRASVDVAPSVHVDEVPTTTAPKASEKTAEGPSDDSSGDFSPRGGKSEAALDAGPTADVVEDRIVAGEGLTAALFAPTGAVVDLAPSISLVPHVVFRQKGQPVPNDMRRSVSKILFSTRDVTVVGLVDAVQAGGGVLRPDVRRLLADRCAGPPKNLRHDLAKRGFRVLKEADWSSTKIQPHAEVVVGYAKLGRRVLHQVAVGLSGSEGHLPDRLFAYEPSLEGSLLCIPPFARWRLPGKREEAVFWVALWVPRSLAVADTPNTSRT